MVRPHHALAAHLDEAAHDPRLHRRHNEEEAKANEGGDAQVKEEDQGLGWIGAVQEKETGWERQMSHVQAATDRSFDGRETQTALNEYHNPS